MNKKFQMRIIASMLMLASSGAMAVNVSTNGYFRAGFGANSDHGDQACFGLGPAKYRLGNECDTYVELGIDSDLGTAANGTNWKAHAMLTGWKDQPSSINGVTTSWSQLYLSGHNLGDGVLQGASLWVGRRYYDRPDIHVLDYKYQNSDGDGAGIESLNLGVAKLSYAMMRTADTGDSSKTATTDDRIWYSNLFRLDSIRLHTDGFLTVNLGLAMGSDSRDETKKAENGSYIGAFYDAKVFSLNAWNRAGIQYGKGSMASGNFGQISWNNNKDDDTVQIFDTVNYESGDGHWTMLANVLYRKDKRKDSAWDNLRWFTVGARPHYHFNDIWGVVTEVGYTRTKTTDNIERNLSKGTVALTAASGRGPFSRPEVRLFYTYAKWNDAAKGWVAYGSPFENDTSGSSFGVQAETWW